MAKFILFYHGGKKPETPEEGQKGMMAWQAWLKKMGSKVIEPGNPLKNSVTIKGNGSVENNGESNPVIGYTIIETETIEEALQHAKECPTLDMGGSIEMAEIISMTG